jgi:hypothetical protein
MLSCMDMYRVSLRMSQALGNLLDPFGRANIGFSGDFAQLRPAGSKKLLYNGKVKTVPDSKCPYKEQKECMGKAVWHGFTTVVLLTENVHQHQLGLCNVAFCVALGNMHYKCCTNADIVLLKSRVIRTEGTPDLTNANFHNISIIVGTNKERDVINKHGCQCFAADAGHPLSHFHLVDSWSDASDYKASATSKQCTKTYMDLLHLGNMILHNNQVLLWSASPEKTDHSAGRLSLCLGMPVLVKKNLATEVCVMNGAEGLVTGWQARKLASDQNALDTLFVELLNPLKLVELDGLPSNVVPVTMSTCNICCKLEGKEYLIKQEQAPVLPNFAMTDYSSQGCTRPYNVVSLSTCWTHQSFYTCLLRSMSIDRTLILEDFSMCAITDGANGDICAEFRALEILNNITKHIYKGMLDEY